MKGPVTGGGGEGLPRGSYRLTQHNNTTFPHKKRTTGHKIPAVMTSAKLEDELWRVIEDVTVAKSGDAVVKLDNRGG